MPVIPKEPLRVSRASPDSKSQSLAVPSTLAVASVDPFALNAVIPAVCPSMVCSRAPVSEFQTWASPSLPPVMTHLPSEE